MTPLQVFWTTLLVISLFLFFLVEIVVTIGGALDLRDLFRTLGRRVKEPESTGDSGPPVKDGGSEQKNGAP
jgi:hypothetical protein